MPTRFALDPRSPTPLYVQLKTAILRLIQAGKLRPHDRLPSERELGEEHGISRMTARRAIQQLIWEGFLYTRTGKGTYVGDVRLEQEQSLTGFSEEMAKRGLMATSRVLFAGAKPASASLAGQLGIAPNADMFQLVRLRFAADLVVAMEAVHISLDLCPGLQQFDFSKQSLYAVLKERYGMTLVSADQTIEAALANPQELALLQLKPPAAILRMKRTTRADSGLVIEYTESVYRSDRYALTTTLHTQSE